ncbi:MAG: hypothetical protein IH851_11805 [Armatimonadetes bacterium]|nr:hypothetical protein [Armatimonadota bacterium]
MFGLLLPAGDTQWRREVRSGFQLSAEQFNLNTKVVEYEEPTPEAILRAAEQIEAADRVPLCVVFTRREQVAPALAALRKAGRLVLTIGVDDAGESRAGHVGGSANRLVYFWRIRTSQMTPVPKRVLFVFGDAPAKRERIEGAVYRRSDEWRNFRPRFRELEELTEEDIAWADLVTPFGSDAVQKCRQLGASRILAADGDDSTLDLVQSGEVALTLAPQHFEHGLRALRLARERYLQGGLSRPVLSIEYEEVDAPSIAWYKEHRYDLP